MRFLHAPVDAMVRLSLRDTKALVVSPRRARLLILRALVGAVLAVGLWVYLNRHLAPSVWLLALSAVMGSVAARAGFCTFYKALSYRSGWLEGRHAMVLSLWESQVRGLTVQEWLEREIEKDMRMER